MNKPFSSDAIKLWAITAMLIDHIAWLFIPLESPLGLASHLIGRTTIPIMCFGVAEGYRFSHDRRRYALRLLLFAALSHLPFVYFETGSIPSDLPALLLSFQHTGVIWPLFLALAALALQDQKGLSLWIKVLGTLGLCALGLFGDWYFFPVLWARIFHRQRENPPKMILFFVLSALPLVLDYPLSFLLNAPGSPLPLWSFFQAGLFLAIPLLLGQNGKRSRSKVLKWGFYAFYPAHLLILGFLRQLFS
ncbi:MAG: conjugal transfer protein TraX [Christensenellaceae bacterium]|nr:conjugal transfer protein TraX [Christensenellaceae bacterium]